MNNQRGMVTIELALVSLLIAGALSLAAWFVGVLVAVDQCQVAADEVARQAARGDAAGVRRASADVPPAASVRVSDAGGATTVIVHYVPSMLGVSVGSFDAKAVVLNEAKP